jgi:hypothetical protein
MVQMLNTLWRRLLACVHGTCGRLWFRLGSPVRARAHFERVLDLGGSAFSAYVWLGRTAYAEGDYAGWRREMEHARRADPERFARLSHPFELFVQRPTGGPFADAGERATWRAMRSPAGQRGPVRAIELPTERSDMAASASRPQPAEQNGTADGTAGCSDRMDRVFGDDFASDAERERFRRLGPIDSRKMTAADLDDICRRLLG